MDSWMYVSNTFLTITRDSYRLAKKIGDYTLSALHAKATDPFFANLYNDLQPIVENFNLLYATWISQRGKQKSFTHELQFKYKTLQSSLIKQWDIAIQNQYLEGTPDYISLLPQRRYSFQHGSQEDRKSACEALSLALQNHPPLANVKLEVDTFILQLDESFITQKGSKGNTKINSKAVDFARRNLCVELYGVLAQLMFHFKETPQSVTVFFDLQSIRNREQTLYKGSLHADETKLAMTHTFAMDEKVLLRNTGKTTLRFALCKLSNESISNTFVEVIPLDELVVKASALGNQSNHFLKIKNMDELLPGKYSIVLL